MAFSSPISYICIPYSFLSDESLKKCSTLFNENYSIGSNDAPLHSNNVLQAGSRVKLSVECLRELLLFSDQFQLIGHAFRTYAKYNRLNGNAVWITQLVVHSAYRRRGVADTLLSMTKNSVEDVIAIGLVSSHPYTIMALCNACNRLEIYCRSCKRYYSNLQHFLSFTYSSHWFDF